MTSLRSILTALALLLICTNLLAQKIEGTITNTKGMPLIGAYIIKGVSGEHAHSDEYGRFHLNEVAIGDTLFASHLGYERQRIILQDLSKPFRIKLQEGAVVLDEVTIRPEIDALNLFSRVDLLTRPVISSQEVLTQVPGLIIGQHAGGGKAEQIFLRGFDIDHGTDVNITVDGVPVNMVSHAHGQGYADLHFLIPETIEGVDFGKGTYYADKGNFTTAGYVDFKTKDRIDESLISVEAGQFNTQRILSMLNLSNHTDHSAYIAAEYLSTDGPFESSQNFGRLNIMAKYQGNITDNDRLSFTASHFNSSWDASGQIPQRAVDQGLITRFGAIDDTEGGTTSRTNIVLEYDKRLDASSFIKNTIFYSYYDFELFSNFTFFLNDPVNGDQIRQREARNLFGINSEFNKTIDIGNAQGHMQLGINLRSDDVNENELSRTLNRREVRSFVQLGDVNESNLGAYLNTQFELGKWSVNPSVRVDYFDFQYFDDLASTYAPQSSTNAIVSPKLNFLYNHSSSIQYYLKLGKGFHSNDTRVSVLNTRESLPAAYGGDLGFIWKPTKRMFINAAIWNLYLEQEFVYVGDEGVVEPSGRTNRQGIDLSMRYQPLNWLYWNVDANYAHARAIDEAEGEAFIPLAPDFTLSSGLNIMHPSGISAGINVLHLSDRPANENNTIIAEGYTVVNANVAYEFKRIKLGVQIRNLLDTDWNETQFATNSRLENEAEPVEEIHFTPGTPFFLKGTVSYIF
jgi:outer membrane cobalamin receptor